MAGTLRDSAQKHLSALVMGSDKDTLPDPRLVGDTNKQQYC